MTKTYHIDRIVVDGTENYNRARLASLIQEALEGRLESEAAPLSPEAKIARQIARAIQEATDER